MEGRCVISAGAITGNHADEKNVNTSGSGSLNYCSFLCNSEKRRFRLLAPSPACNYCGEPKAAISEKS
jgi:hypothetical protein